MIKQGAQCVLRIIRNIHCVSINLLQAPLFLMFFYLQVYVINRYFIKHMVLMFT